MQGGSIRKKKRGDGTRGTAERDARQGGRKVGRKSGGTRPQQGAVRSFAITGTCDGVPEQGPRKKHLVNPEEEGEEGGQRRGCGGVGKEKKKHSRIWAEGMKKLLLSTQGRKGCTGWKVKWGGLEKGERGHRVPTLRRAATGE